MQPSPDLIRAADVIWIQSNALPHAFFYKIINVARSNNKRVRYFATASATKCAMQVVDEDRRVDN